MLVPEVRCRSGWVYVPDIIVADVVTKSQDSLEDFIVFDGPLGSSGIRRFHICRAPGHWTVGGCCIRRYTNIIQRGRAPPEYGPPVPEPQIRAWLLGLAPTGLELQTRSRAL